jgi:phospholipid/cholesterol/gamma-HCH transport system substrate-binding protein
MRRNQKRTLSNFAAGVLALVLITVGTYLGFTKAIPFQHHYTIHAAFNSANNLRKNAFVRIAGVNVGKVTGVHQLKTAGGQGGAMVDMRIDDVGLPLHTDATAAIRPRIFLEGNFFVDLSPGSPSAPTMHDGGTIPVQNDTSPVQLDQILTSLQAGTRANLQTLIEEYAKGLSAGGAAGFNKSIPYWVPAYRDSSVVNDATLGQNPGDLAGYIKDAGTAAAALDRSPAALQGLITDFNTTAAAFAVQQNALGQTIADLPKTLHAALPAFAALNNAFPAVRRLVVDFRPAVRSSGPALDAGIPLITQLRGLVSKPELQGLVHDLRPTVPALARLNTATVPLLQQSRLLSSCANHVILPWSHQTVPDPNFPATGQVFQESPKSLVGLAGESRTGDANGFWFRVLLNAGAYAYNLGGGSFAMTAFPLLGANPPKALARPALRPDVPCETQTPPNLNTVIGAPPASANANANSPAAQALYAKLKVRAITWLRGQLAQQNASLRAQGKPTVNLKVGTQDITPAQIQQLAGANGHLGQLNELNALLRRKPYGAGR